MHLTETRVAHESTHWRVDFVGDNGESVTVHLADSVDKEVAVERARAIMVQLTAFGTRGGGRSVNSYDAASNGNFDDGEPELDTRH